MGRPYNHDITRKYELAKELVSAGRSIKYACIETGLDKGQWDSRLKQEKKAISKATGMPYPRYAGTPLNPEITSKFEAAKELVDSGKTIQFACDATGLTREQWKSRMRIYRRRHEHSR